MTVAELMQSILTAYPGASPDALATFQPVFRDRLGSREGPHLAAAFTTCLAEFKPTSRQPFPIPLDIESRMPAMPSSTGRPIAADLERRAERGRELLADWLAGQGAKIRAARAQPLYAACLLEAQERARRGGKGPVILSQDDIVVCFQRAVSTARAQSGRLPADAGRWWQEVSAIARGWGIVPPWPAPS